MKTDDHPVILEQHVSDRTAELRLLIPSNNDCFNDHFPSAPIVPGIVLLHWAVEFARRFFEVDKHISSIEVLKFRKSIAPNSTVSLKLEIVEGAGRIYFDYSAEDSSISSGRIILE
jgi:3-hydroxymyristoyl/3-hydroxydecanoyl-(acyl carrier protein) dehydratase